MRKAGSWNSARLPRHVGQLTSPQPCGSTSLSHQQQKGDDHSGAVVVSPKWVLIVCISIVCQL